MLSFASLSPRRVVWILWLALISGSLASVALAQPAASPAIVQFPAVPVGTTSAAQQVTLTNNQASSLTISGIGASSHFTIGANTCPISPSTLAAHSSCAVSVTATPAQGGLVQGTLTFTDNAANSPTVVNLGAAGTTGGPTSVSSPALAYGNVAINQASPAQVLTFTNNLASAINITGVTIPAHFSAASNSCSGSLGANASCSISLKLTPVALGGVSGPLLISDSADASPIEVYLYGTGVPAVTVSPSPLAFGNIAVGVQTIQTLTLTNNQTAPLTPGNSTLVGAGYSIVQGSTTCQPAPAQLAGGASCVVAIGINPGAAGNYAGTLTLVDNSPTSPHVVSLSATGVQASSAVPSAINFGNIVVNATSASKTVTFQNLQSSNLTLSSFSVPVGSPFRIDPTSTCVNGAVLAPGAVCTAVVKAKPSTATTSNGLLTFTPGGGAAPVTVALTVTGVPAFTVSPNPLAFGTVPLNVQAVQTITLTNNQTVPLVSSNGVLTGTGYHVVLGSTTCPLPPTPLAPGASCVVAVGLTPTAAGSYPGSFQFINNAPNSPQTVTFTATAAGSSTTATVSPSSLSFGNVALSATSASQAVTLTNTGSSSISISSIATASPFTVAGTTCGVSLAAAASCTVSVTATPATTTLATGSLTFTDGASNSPQTVSLSVTGVVPAALGPASLSFGSIPVNTISSGQSVTLTNNQSTALGISAVNFIGPFALSAVPGSSTCPVPSGALAAGASCVYSVVFNPTAIGPATGQISIVDGASNSPQTASLSGRATLATSISTTSLSFGNVAVGTTSAAQTVTLTNLQLVPLNFSSISVPAPYALLPGSTTCVVGTPVASNASCSVAVTLAPTAIGAVAAASLTLVHDAVTSPQSVSLSGAGIAPIGVSTGTLAFGQVITQQAYTQTVSVTNNLPYAALISSANVTGSSYSLIAGSTTCGATIASGATCVYTIGLTAPTAGSYTGALTIVDNAPSSPQIVNLTATAVPAVLVAPTSLTFVAQLQGTTSAGQTITLTNNQAIPLSITSLAFSGANSGDFGVTSGCPASPSTLPATSNCSLVVTFTPTATGTRTATLTINDDAVTSPAQTITLTGAGNAPLTISPVAALNYAAPVGTNSTFVQFTVTNTNAGAPVHIGSFQTTGDFTETATSCPIGPAAFGAGAQCVVTVNFLPTIAGTRGGQLLIYDDTVTSPQVVNLQGIGTNPLTLSTNALIFQPTKIGTTSATLSATLTNHESQSETFTLGVTGAFTAISNCPGGVIAANSNCTLVMTFDPTVAGPNFGSVTVSHTAANGSPLSLGLSGSALTHNPAGAVTGVSPGAGTIPSVTNVTITGNGWTNFDATSTITFLTQGLTTACTGVTATIPTPASTTANVISAQVTVAANTPPGGCDIQVTTGSEVDFLSAAFIVADSTNSHIITTVTPNFGTQGQNLNVDLTATGTSFQNGVTYANFGSGIQVNSLNVTSSTTAQANISISNTTNVGYRQITLVTGGEFAVSDPQAFQILANNATLVSVSPNTAPQGGSLSVNLVATGTHFVQGATSVSITGGVNIGNIQVTSPTTATADIAVTQGATVGLQNVTVFTGGEIATLGNAFTVTGATPYLSGVNPSAAQQGQTLDIDITGIFTNFATNQVLLNMGGDIQINSYNVISPTHMTANITVSLVAAVTGRTAYLTVGPNGNQAIFPFYFTVTSSPAQIVSVTPSNVPQGGQVTLAIVGLNTHWVQGTTTAAFDPIPVGSIGVDLITVTDATHATLNISVSTDHPVGGHGFYMATGGEVVRSAVSVYANTPTVNVSPSSGLPGTAFSVSFTGSFTHFDNTTLPVVSGQGVTLSSFNVTSPVSATGTIAIASGAPFGGRTITLTTGGEIVTTPFVVTNNAAYLCCINPYEAVQGTTLNVDIVGVNTHFAAGSTIVNFDPTIAVNSSTILSATDLHANIAVSPTSIVGWHTAYVNTGAEQVLIGFYVLPPPNLHVPAITAVTPASGPQGSVQNVTITGANTNWVQGTTEVILGAGVTVSNLQITSPTTATATVSVSPTAPVGGNTVVMITGTEIESGSGFSVTPNAAIITLVQPVCADPNYANAVQGTVCTPPSGPPVLSQLQTVTLSVKANGTHWLQGETTFNFGGNVVVDKLTINSATSAIVQITVLSSAPIGFAPLTTFTDGESVTLQQAIDIEQGFPILLSTTPGGGLQGATLNLQVLGQFTHWVQGATSAAFNQDITVNSFTVIDNNNAVANITVSPLAYVDFSCSPSGHTITITTGTEQVSIPGSFCVGRGAAQITNVYPPNGAQGTTETVSVTGSATNFIDGVTTASFGSGINVGVVTVTSPTTATIPIAITTQAPTGYTSVTLTTRGEVATQQFAFQVSPDVATLNEAIPNIAEQGAPLAGQPTLNIHLIGQYSHFSAQSTATFGAGITVNSVSYTDPTDLTVNITVDPLAFTGGRNVTVTTPGVPCSVLIAEGLPCSPGATTGSEIVSAGVFQVVPGPAIITSVSPSTGNQGQEVVFNITGSNTHWIQNVTSFYINGGGQDIAINAVVINSPTSATVDMTIGNTANLGTRSIYMQTGGESLVDSGAFVITGGIPVITYLSPNSAVQGTTGLDVTIHGLYTNWDNTSTVNFGPGVVVTQVQVENSTTIDAIINVDPAALIGYHTVFVQTGAQGLASNFNVLSSSVATTPPTPYISYYAPSSGLPGQTFTISFTGQSTHWDPVTTTANFGNNITVNTFQVTSPTSARANITIDPNAPASSNLITFTTGTEVETAGFSIVVSVPTLTIVDPGSGLQGATNLNVNILGQYTTFDPTTTFNFGQGITVNSVTIIGPTIASANISINQLAQLGGRSVTATTGGQTVGGAGFSVTPSLALISAISPNTALQGQTVTVDVQGQNTHWSPATVFTFGDGITVTNVVVNSPTDATVTISIPPYAGEGTTSAQAVTAGEVATLYNAFVVQPGTPYLLSSGPTTVPQQSTVIFTILSQATTWLSTPPTVDFGPGITVTNVNVTGNTSLTATGFAQPTTPVGYRNLTVTSGAQSLILYNAVYVSPGPAVVNSLSPATAGQGVNIPSLAINGTNTHWQQGVTTLSFPGALVNSLTITSPTTAVANVTISAYANPGFVSISMTTLGEVASETNAFTITQTQPQILFINPASAVQGATKNVTITTLFTHFDNTTAANFGAGVTVNSVTALTATSLQVNITVQPTAALGYRNVALSTGTENVAVGNLFQVTQGPAAILSLSPNAGQQNQSYTVLVTGSQTNFAQGVTTAAFGGGIQVTGLTVVDLLHANVQISIPTSTPVGNYNVSLTTGGEVATILGGFNVTAGSAVLTTVAPPTGHQGDTNLNVSLTGLFTSWVNGVSAANFGAGITVNSLNVSNPTSAVANITIASTATIGSRTVTVATTGQIATDVGGFSVLAGVPTLVSASPGTGQAGATLNVVVNGAFTNFVQGTSTVSFGSGITVNTVTVANGQQLTANVSIDPNTGVGSRNITVQTAAENVTLSNGFMVLPGTPLITVINPNIGTPNAAVTVTITGQYTNWLNGTSVANFGPGISVGGAALGANGPVTVNSPTSLTASITIDPAAALGPRTVVVATSAEIDTVAAGFTVQPTTVSPPSIISLSPGYGVTMPISSSIVAVFSQPMDRTTFTSSSVYAYLYSNQGQNYIPVAGAISVDASGRIMTFTPSSPLAVNSSFYLQITNAVKDASGNTFPTYTDYFYTSFAAATTPTVVAANPVAGNTSVGTNAPIQLEFNGEMNQSTQAGMTLTQAGVPVSGAISWNAAGTILTFTPAAPLTPGTAYAVNYGAPLADTSGNALVADSFTFATGSGPDTANNTTYVDFTYFEGNIGTNYIPRMHYAKPINPIDINGGTLFLYNYDSGKYLPGTVLVAPDGLSATFTPNVTLLPNTAYTFYQAGGHYDMDGNYLSGSNNYFITGRGTATAPPQVTSVSPAGAATGIPLNAQVVLHMSEPLDPITISGLTVTPSGGSAIPGTISLASDQVTLTFVPSGSLLGNANYTVAFSGYKDLAGNTGVSYISTFTTSASVVPLNVSTGFTAGGTLSTVNNTPDANWTVKVGANPPVAAEVVGPGDTGWYGAWFANGPKSSWIALNPNSVTGNALNPYSTTFNLTGYSLNNLCLVGGMSIDDNGSLLVNGTPITGNITGASSFTPLNVALPSGILNAGLNTLSLQWGSIDNYYEAFRLQATIQTCGSTLTGGLSLVSASPAINATGVSTNTPITLTFNNPLDPATVTDTTLPVMIGWNSNQIIAGNWVVNGAQATFTPNAPFPPNTTIYVGECGGPYDLAGDTYPNCYQYQLEHFTTGSAVTPPSAPFQVTAFSPGLNATNVGLRAPVTATFNRSFNPNTINQSAATQDFNLYAGYSEWCNSYSRSTDNSTLQFNCGALPASTQMTALINGNLKDMAGNGVANFSSSFTTSAPDTNAHGSIVTTRPGNGTVGIAAGSPLVFYTSLPINPASANAGLQVAQNNVALNGTVQVLDNGYSLVFTPSSPLTPGALIQWWITGSLMDSQLNVPFNATNGYFYVAATTSTTAPAITAASPALYTYYLPQNTIFDFQFNTPLDPTTVIPTNIYLYDSSTGLKVPATYTMPQPNEVRIVPNSDLSSPAYIYLYVTAGLHSATSVPATPTTPYFYVNAVDDTTTATVVSAVPYNGAGNIGVNITPGVVFSKAIDPVSLNASTFQITNAGTPLAGTYMINNTDTRIAFVPNAPLPASTSLHMVLNGVLDMEGHPVNFNSTFQTGPGPDLQAPTVVYTSIPNNGSVPTNATLTVQFSESMDSNTFNSNNLRIYDYTLGNYISTTTSWSADQSVAYVTPTSPLGAGHQFNLYIASGTDLAGNNLQGVSFTFYTTYGTATSGPSVLHVNPINGTTGLGLNALIEAQFSAAIDPNTIGNVTLTNAGGAVAMTPSFSAGNTILQLTPAVPLAANTTYTVTIAGVKDPAGNVVTTYTYSFTTGTTIDISGPSAINSNPPGSSTVGTNFIPKLIFNKPLNPLTVNTGTFRMYLYQTGQFIPTTPTLSPNGLVVTMLPQIPLLPGTEYYFQACCGYQDMDGNNGNGLNVYVYTGSGTDTAAPTVIANPANGAASIPLNAQVDVAVNKPVDPTSWTSSSVQLHDNLNNPIAGTLTLSDPQTFVFVPTGPLSAGTTYTVQVGNFTDAMGNAVAPVNSIFTTGSSTSSTGLTFTSSNIPFGSTNVSATQTIILTFSQVLDPNTVNAATLKVMNGWNSNYPLGASYAVNGNQVTITPASPWPAGASIYVGECGGPTDILGDVFLNGGCYGQQLVHFVVSSGAPDTTPLQVMSVSPANNATNVGINTAISVNFNKSINPGSVNANDAIVFAGQGAQDRGSITLSADGRTITFNTGALYGGTAYTVNLAAGGITDASGNALTTDFISSFTTASYPATGNGSVTATSPSANASSVPIGSLLTLYLNRAVNAATLNGNFIVTVDGVVDPGTVTAAAGNFEVQFTPTTPFPNGALVQWAFSNVLDVNGDYFYASSGTFNTVAASSPTSAPQQIAVSPVCCGTSGLPTNTQIEIAYSLPIDPTTLAAGINFSGGVPATITLASPNVVRIVPTGGLSGNTFYYVCTSGALKGTNGTPISGNCYSTYFYTGTTGPDNTTGTMTIGPPASSIGVGTNAYIRLNFSKAADPTTVNSTTVAVTDGGSAVPGTFSYNYNNGSSVVGATFSPLNPLPPSTVIQVAVNGIIDTVGNAFTPVTQHFTTAATPDTSQASVSYAFAGNTSNIGTNAAFTCTYTKPMDPSSFAPANVYVYNYATSTKIPVTYTFSTDMMSVTLTPTSPLTPNTQYNYECYNAIDLTGNAQQNNGGPYFYTGGGPITTGPALVYSNPPNGSTNVALNDFSGPWNSTNLMLQFNEPLSHLSLGNITLTPQGGAPLAIGTSLQIGDTTVIVNLPSTLRPNTTYTYSVSGVTDYNGNPGASATSTFTTGSSFDFVSPGVSAFVPANGTTGVSATAPALQITFSEPMNPVLFDSSHVLLVNHNTQAVIPTTFTFSSDFTSVFLTPTAPLTAATIYDLKVNIVNWYLYDLAGNGFNVPTKSTFTTQ